MDKPALPTDLPAWARSDVAVELLSAIVARPPEEATIQHRLPSIYGGYPDGFSRTYVGKPAARLRQLRKEWVEREYSRLDWLFAVSRIWDDAEAARILRAEEANDLIARVLASAGERWNASCSMSGLDWTDSEEAMRLLAELDAAERASDCYSGWGWREVSRSFGERCEEIESELDDLRSDAVNAIADTTSDDRRSDEWLDAWEEADNEAESVRDACQRARRLHLGDGLIERAAAA